MTGKNSQFIFGYMYMKKKGRFAHDLQRQFGLLRCARTVVRTSIWLEPVTVAAASLPVVSSLFVSRQIAACCNEPHDTGCAEVFFEIVAAQLVLFEVACPHTLFPHASHGSLVGKW